jgi:hypothetical protein
MVSALEAINKYGIPAGMAIAIVWFNNRLNVVEERLYDCYEQRVFTSAPISHKKQVEKNFVFAIIPSDPVGKVKENV